MSLRNKTISGVGWSAFGRVIKQGAQFVLSIFLMRLLSPDAYGLIGMALVFIGFANIFKEFGFGSAIVQRSHLAESHYSSTFYLNIIIGIGLALIFILCAPLLASFYGDPRLTVILQVLAIDFLIAGFGIVPRSVLQRSMRFDILSKIEVAAAVIPGFIAVILAFNGVGIWALVTQTLLSSLVSVVLYAIYSPWKPRLLFSANAVKQLWFYSANLTGFQMINYWARSADDLLIGKFMGSSSLGIYTRAYSLMLLPIKQIISVISSVMFSALSKIQREKDRVKRVYLKTMQVLAFVSFPIMVGLFIVAEPFVLAIFGQQWSGIIPLIQILTWVGLTQTICNPTGWIYQSQGKTDWLFYWGLFGSSSLIIAIIVGVWWGTVESVAISYAVMNVLITYPCIAIPGRLINMSFWDVMRAVYPSFLNSMLMAGFVFTLSMFLPANWDQSLVLIIEVATGAFIYITAAYLINLDAFVSAKNLSLEYHHRIKN